MEPGLSTENDIVTVGTGDVWTTWGQSSDRLLISTMSAIPQVKLVATNIRAEDLLMDIRGGGKDSRYYCLPPFHGKKTDGESVSKESVGKGGGGYPYHLVAQGHRVGIFDDW